MCVLLENYDILSKLSLSRCILLYINCILFSSSNMMQGRIFKVVAVVFAECFVGPDNTYCE
jgi:hypothetical protein